MDRNCENYGSSWCADFECGPECPAQLLKVWIDPGYAYEPASPNLKTGIKILNIYGQEYWHTDAKIVGNILGLLELRDKINEALKNGVSRTCGDHPIFASDGEGYELFIECHDDDWGIDAPEDSFWNKEESAPRYTGLTNAQ